MSIEPNLDFLDIGFVGEFSKLPDDDLPNTLPLAGVGPFLGPEKEVHEKSAPGLAGLADVETPDCMCEVHNEGRRAALSLMGRSGLL